MPDAPFVGVVVVNEVREELGRLGALPQLPNQRRQM